MLLEWLTTASSGRTRTCEADDGQTGWKRHGIIIESSKATFADVNEKHAVALCGLKPRTGWGFDLFIETPCLRCVERALKLGLKVEPEIMRLYQQARHSKDDFKEWQKNPKAYNKAHRGSYV